MARVSCHAALHLGFLAVSAAVADVGMTSTALLPRSQKARAATGYTVQASKLLGLGPWRGEVPRGEDRLGMQI